VPRRSPPRLIRSEHEHHPRRRHRALGQYSLAGRLRSQPRRRVRARNHHHRRARRDHLAKLIDAAAWPTWYSSASDVVVNDPSGTLGEGVTFDWTTFGLKIASTIAECVPHTRIGWYGTGAQLRAYHTWLLIPRNGNSTYVVMEETGLGPAARHLAQTNPGHMHRGHELWNWSLKFACES